jgi:hypothetical protein
MHIQAVSSGSIPWWVITWQFFKVTMITANDLKGCFYTFLNIRIIDTIYHVARNSNDTYFSNAELELSRYGSIIFAMRQYFDENMRLHFSTTSASISEKL